MMKPVETRRFGMMDLVILVAAVAVGLALDRWVQYRDEHNTPWTVYSTSASIDSNNAMAAMVFSPVVTFLAALSAAFLAFRLRSPRPRRRRLMAQPGFIAGLVILASLGLESALATFPYPREITLSTSQVVPRSFDPITMLIPLTRRAGMELALAWSVQALVGRWRAEKSWVDRGGRAIAVAWLIVAAATTVVEALGLSF